MPKTLRVGYNFIERKALGRKFDEFDTVLSLVEFARRLRSAAPVPNSFRLVGLDSALYHAEDREAFCVRLRRLLSQGARQLFRTNPTIQIVVDRLMMDRHPKIVVQGTEISLYPIFGRTLEQIEADWFYSTFTLA